MALVRCRPDELPADQSGVFVRARAFAFAVTSRGLCVTVAWGALDHQDAQLLAAVWERTFPGPPRPSLIDITAVTTIDATAFTTIRDLLEGHRAERARTVVRQAIVSADDLGGSIVRGYLAMFPPPYPLRSFVDRAPGLAWLGHAGCAAEVHQLAASRLDLVARLRDWLEQAPADRRSIDQAAAALGVTRRTLQRRLAAADTRYAHEVAQAQVAAAQRLMLAEQRTLSEIALEVGCATPSAFSDLFRRVTGQTPTAWRRQARPPRRD